jgi:hypothetical protein
MALSKKVISVQAGIFDISKELENPDSRFYGDGSEGSGKILTNLQRRE